MRLCARVHDPHTQTYTCTHTHTHTLITSINMYIFHVKKITSKMTEEASVNIWVSFFCFKLLPPFPGTHLPTHTLPLANTHTPSFPWYLPQFSTHMYPPPFPGTSLNFPSSPCPPLSFLSLSLSPSPFSLFTCLSPSKPRVCIIYIYIYIIHTHTPTHTHTHYAGGGQARGTTRHAT